MSAVIINPPGGFGRVSTMRTWKEDTGPKLLKKQVSSDKIVVYFNFNYSIIRGFLRPL